MKLEELHAEYWKRIAGKRGATVRSAPAADVARWDPLPGQSKGDAKDEETRIREMGFNPERFEADPEYQSRPEIQALAERYVRVAAPRETAARTAEMVATSRYVATHAAEMQVQLRRDELDRAIAKLQAERTSLPAADDDEGPEDEALIADDTETPPEQEDEKE